ncbi:S9 family peptidase [Luminiphilus sp.]|nr:S9 family peptidase [Luminiphilus sp.]
MQSIKLKRRHKSRFLSAVSLVICTFFSLSIFADETAPAFGAMDVFELEWASDPQISPDGQEVIYRRMGFDIMKDKRRGNLWRVRADGENHQKLTNFEGNETSPQWSPDGQRIAYVKNAGKEGAEIYVLWLDSGRSARITHVEGSPSHLRWSPTGTHIAFAMTAKTAAPLLVKRPSAPEGAKWADKPRVTDRLYHERDGSGYVEPGFSHVYVVPAEGGTPRQVSEGNFHHLKPEWRSDGRALTITGNRSENWQYDFRNSEVYTIDLVSGDIAPLTTISGPDDSPLPSPDGQWVAWLGFTDKRQAYQVTRLRIAKPDGSAMKELLVNLDRSIDAIHWAADAGGLYYQYDDKGRTKIGYVTMDDRNELIADNLGGTSIGRPYGGGSFSVSAKGDIAYTHTRPEFPADVAIATPNGPRKITHLNSDLLGHRALGETRELWWESRVDGLQTQGWITLPPNFDPAKKYPLLVENHGGPISNYGERFSPEIQLYAAAGYVVFFPNARGSTGYGEDFGNLLYHNYPGEDYNDVMDGVDAVINQGFIDPEQLYVTGGSAGGIMTAWMIGKNDRFRAAAVIKPVMNWYSKTLNADNWFYYFETRIPGTPWTHPNDYLRFSPISLVGNVTTPTLVMVGLEDLRTPPSQAKQLYHALKYRKVPTVLVELPGASHFIAKKPSQLIDKIDNILAWFERYKDNAPQPEGSSAP